MTFREFCDELDRRFEAQQERAAWQLQRRGQVAYNLFSELDSEAAVQVNATPIDPYHADERLPAFLAYVAARMTTR